MLNFPCNTLKYTLVGFLNIIRVYYKCILKFFANIIFLNDKFQNPEFVQDTRVKVEFVKT